MIQVAYPWVFITIVLPFLWRWLLPKISTQDSTALKVPFFERLQHSFANGMESGTQVKTSFLKYCLILIWVLLVVSGAGIQWLGKPLSLPQSGRDLMLAIDLSGSMQTPDMALGNGQNSSRIEVVKKVATQFIAKRNGDRLGLILFGSRPYLQTPLTFDRQTIQQMLNDATVGIAGTQTAIGDAIGLAVKQIIDYPKESKALILLTDGGNNAGVLDPLKAAELAKQEGIKIYTIGLGAGQMTVQTLFGTQTVNPSSDLDIEGLKQIAAITGGEFFRAEDSAGLERIYATINNLEPIESDKVTVRPITPFYPWTLGAALTLSFLVIVVKIIRSKQTC